MEREREEMGKYGDKGKDYPAASDTTHAYIIIITAAAAQGLQSK